MYDILIRMHNTTEHIYRQKINKVIDYVSTNLHKPLSLDMIANQIHVSQRQLLRIMRTALNESLSAYVARQRVERAVMYMQTEELNLTTIAAMVGYDNPQSFSKAFRKHFGISPKAYLDMLYNHLETYAKCHGNGQSNLYSEIHEEDDLELVYIRIIGKYGEDKPYETAWNKLVCFIEKNSVLSDKTRFIGISFDDPNVTCLDRCRFYACASTEKKIAPSGEFGTIQIRKGKYAVYTLKGSYAGLQELYNVISLDSKHVERHGLAFEEYINNPLDTDEAELLTKIFIPIK
ncbi:MAG: GyrI-like domain-containing protein [Prevotellaceae bacterium]|nr:GyrI-like domain-containing protein [Prevotellaceae bacterium]